MLRFLLFFTLLFLEISTCNSRQFVFALEEQGDEENSDETEEESTENSDEESPRKKIHPQIRKKQVRSIVDGILSISKRTDHTKKQPANKSSAKKNDNNYGNNDDDDDDKDDEDTDASSKDDDDSDNDDNDDSDEQVKKKKSIKNKPKRKKKSPKESSYFPKKIYTVKNIYLPKNATNRYLSRISGRPSVRKTETPKGKVYPSEYSIKSYGSGNNNVKHPTKNRENDDFKEKRYSVKISPRPYSDGYHQ
jgi:hypothetical protein